MRRIAKVCDGKIAFKELRHLSIKVTDQGCFFGA
jgi:hypothetical protein